MVTASTSAAQRRTTRSRRAASAKQRPAAKQRPTRRRTARKHRQAYVGDMALGYPFDPEAAPKRDPTRQALYEKYASKIMPAVEEGMTAVLGRKPKWHPTEADAIDRLNSSMDGLEELAKRFIASTYVLDLAHALADKLSAELKQIKSRGRINGQDVVMKKVAGIISNATGIKVTTTTPEDMTRLLKQIRAYTDAQPKERFGRNETLTMYPIDFTVSVATLAAVGARAQTNQLTKMLANDKCLRFLLDDIQSGTITPNNYSLLSQIKIFAPLSNSIYPAYGSVALTAYAEGMKADAEAMSRGAYFNPVTQHPTAPPERADVYSTLSAGTGQLQLPVVRMPFSMAQINGQTIKTYELETLEARVKSIVGMAGDILAKALEDDRFTIPNAPVDDFLFAPGCGAGSAPIFLDRFNHRVDGMSMGNGRYIAPGAVRARCISGGSSLPSAGQRRAAPASQRRAPSASQKTLSLRQVEALPKKELAKFVQRVVNIA